VLWGTQNVPGSCFWTISLTSTFKLPQNTKRCIHTTTGALYFGAVCIYTKTWYTPTIFLFFLGPNPVVVYIYIFIWLCPINTKNGPMSEVKFDVQVWGSGPKPLWKKMDFPVRFGHKPIFKPNINVIIFYIYPTCL